jgi:hypothetical protein
VLADSDEARNPQRFIHVTVKLATILKEILQESHEYRTIENKQGL